jgi:hypothetical protein
MGFLDQPNVGIASGQLQPERTRLADCRDQRFLSTSCLDGGD